MWRRISFFFYGWAYLTLTLPQLWYMIYLHRRGRMAERDRIGFRFLAQAGRRLFLKTGSSLTITGLEHIPDDEPVVFIANHHSPFDSALLMGFVPKPKGFIAAVEAQAYPIFRTWTAYSPYVFMDREDKRQSVEAINQGVELIKQGYSLVIYPEGRIIHGEGLDTFSRGSIKLATKAGVPIVPVAIRGTSWIMGEDYRHVRPSMVELHIAEPIPTNDLSRAELVALPKRVTDAIAEKLGFAGTAEAVGGK